MLAPLDADGEMLGGDLLGRWGDLTVRDLPPVAQVVALTESSWRAIVNALAEPIALAEACESFVADLLVRLERRHDERIASITLARAGLLSDDVPTLAELGVEWGVTRARVQQLERPLQGVTGAELGWRAPLRLVIAAHFAVRPRIPLDLADMAEPRSPIGRAVRLALDMMDVPKASMAPDLWTRTHAEER